MRDLFVIAHGKLQHGLAGRRWARGVQRLREIFGEAVEIQFTSQPGDATQLSRRALESGADWLAAAGGDGTIHEVVNGYFEAGINIRPSASLSFLPCGSGNDWVRTLEIPTDVLAAVAALPRSRIRTVDVGFASFQAPDGLTGQRVFLNVAEAGVGGELVARINDGLAVARTRIGYRLGAIAVALCCSRNNLQLVIDGGRAISTGPMMSLIIAGGRYFGSGMQCAPMARPDDGLLEVIVLGDFGKAELLYKIHRFFSGTYITDSKATHRSARSVEAQSSDRVFLELDGELVGSLPASFRVLPRALAIRC